MLYCVGHAVFFVFAVDGLLETAVGEVIHQNAKCF